MGYLENLPGELLELIVPYLGKQEWMNLRATSRRFEFLRGRIFRTVNFDGSATDVDKARAILEHPDAHSLVQNCVFNTVSESFAYCRVLDAMERESHVLTLLAQSRSQIEECRVIGNTLALRDILEMIRHAGLPSLKRISIFWAPSTGNDAQKSGGISTSDPQQCRTCLCCYFSLSCMVSHCNGLTYMNLEEVHVYCNWDVPVSRLRVRQGLYLNLIGNGFTPPQTLRRILLCYCRVNETWLKDTLLCLPNIESVAMFHVNLVTRPQPLTEAGSVIEPALEWQEFAEAFDSKFEGRESRSVRLYINQPQEDAIKVRIDDTHLGKVTLISDEQALVIRDRLEDMTRRIWETLESFQ
ncbi:hypothetical protein Plec18170_008277 [Paecilomyces lecythidis]